MYEAFKKLLTLNLLCLCYTLAHASAIGSRHIAPSLNQEVVLSKAVASLTRRSDQVRESEMGHNYRDAAESSVHALKFKRALQNLENPKIFFPPGVQEKVVPGASLWNLSVTSHRDSNAHHNYATTDRAVAQEIALDFFSSALVSCLLVDVPINAGRVKRAFVSIHNWPSYNKGSPTVREGIAFMGRALFRHYYVSDETEEVDIPSKPYEVEVAKARKASERLVKAWADVTGNKYLANEKEIKESRIFFELVTYLKNNVYEDCLKAWKQMLPVMLDETELGKWVKEVDSHKKLVVKFHEYCREAPGYLVTDAVAKGHDDDKYIPFNLLAYTLNWYYGDVGIVE